MANKINIDISRLEEEVEGEVKRPRRKVRRKFTLDNLKEFLEEKGYSVAKCRNCGHVIVGVNSMCPLCGYVFTELIKRYDIPTPPPFGPIETEEDFVRAVEIRRKYHLTPSIIERSFEDKPYSSDEKALQVLKQLLEEFHKHKQNIYISSKK